MSAQPAFRRLVQTLAVTAAALLVGCGPRASDAGKPARGEAGSAQDDDLGLGAAWEQPKGGRGTVLAAPAGARPAAWAVVLATFPPGAHADAPDKFAVQLRGRFPQLQDVWAHTGAEGAVVAYGHYEGPQEETAQRDLKMIKALRIRNAPAFPLAMLSRVGTGPAPIHPFALMSLRLRYPNLEPLYSLEVGVWGDFGANKLSLEEIHKQAEAYARTLRAQGVEAWFYHDDDKQLSSVTIGHFDYHAIDSRTGLFSTDVEAIIARFPAHLVNGEDLQEPISGRDPRRGTRLQRPTLVEVPKR